MIACLCSFSNDHRYPIFVVIIIRSFPYSWPITGIVTRVIRRVSDTEQELLNLSGAPEFTLILVGFVLISLYIYVYCFVDLYLYWLSVLFWSLYCLCSICDWLLHSLVSSNLLSISIYLMDHINYLFSIETNKIPSSFYFYLNNPGLLDPF